MRGWTNVICFRNIASVIINHKWYSERDWVSTLLMTIFENVIDNKLKQISIGHSVVQSNRPRSVISPVLFGVRVSLDHMFGSRILLDMLARLGFSISHSFTQWSGDNVDRKNSRWH